MTQELIVANQFTRDQVELIKRTVAKDTTDDELQLFLITCQRTGLDPFARQIHAVKRKSGGNSVMTIQTGIDGYRLMADRSQRYAPGREPSFVYDTNNDLYSATAYVKKLVAGSWHEVAATALYIEYAQMYDGRPNTMWKKMPHTMLAKCAEALALRRAFPAELSGLYTSDEMQQADAPEVTAVPTLRTLPEVTDQRTQEAIQQGQANRPSEMPQATEDAQRRFYNRYVPIIGGLVWANVCQYLNYEDSTPEPTSVQAWLTVGENVRSESRRREAEQQAEAARTSADEDYDAIEEAVAA